MFGLFTNAAQLRDMGQILGRALDRIAELETRISELEIVVSAEKQMRINNEKALLNIGRELRDTTDAFGDLVGESAAVFSFVNALSTTGLRVKLDYERVDNEANPDGELETSGN